MQQELDQPHPALNANFSFSSIDAQVKNIQCASFALASAWVSPDSDGSVLSADVSGLSGVCAGLWEYEEHIWPHLPHDKGSVLVDISNVNVSAQAKIVATADDHLLVSMVSCSSNITIRNIDFEGGVITEALVAIFKSKIKDGLSRYLQTMVCSEIEKVIASNFSPSNSSNSSSNGSRLAIRTKASLSSPSLPSGLAGEEKESVSHTVLRRTVVHFWRSLMKPPNSTLGVSNAIFTKVEIYSVWQSVMKLFEMEEHFLGGALLILSGLWPHVKQLLLLLFWFLPIRTSRTHKALFWIDMIGKWSMVDVLFVGMLFVVLRLDIDFLVRGSLVVVPLEGVYVYSLSILLSMALTMVVTHLARVALLSARNHAHEMSSTSDEDDGLSNSYAVPAPDEHAITLPTAVTTAVISITNHSNEETPVTAQEDNLPPEDENLRTAIQAVAAAVEAGECGVAGDRNHDDSRSNASDEDVLTPLTQPLPLSVNTDAGENRIQASPLLAPEQQNIPPDIPLAQLWQCCFRMKEKAKRIKSDRSTGEEGDDEGLRDRLSAPVSLRRRMVLVVAVLVEVVTTVLGLWLFMCEAYDRLHIDVRGINVYGSEQSSNYSVIRIVQLMASWEGGQKLSMLFLVFVVIAPLLKWGLALGFWFLCSFRCMWRYVHLLHPLDMRDVFMVTLLILCLRIRTTTEGLSQGFASMHLDVSEMPGFYFTLVGLAIDYCLFGYSLHKVEF